MKPRLSPLLAGALASALLAACTPMQTGTPPASQNRMGFFVTSTNPGRGADLGGLAGADRHCQALASAAGAGQRVWRAYLSATPSGGAPAVNARDRIGRGPWYNARGELIARDAAELHGERNNINK